MIRRAAVSGAGMRTAQARSMLVLALLATPAFAAAQAAPTASPTTTGAAVAPAAQTPPTATEPASTAQTTSDPATTASDATPPVSDDDYQALYGNPSGNQAAGAAGGAPVYDPWERYNRHVHHFNNAVDRHVAKPLATTYVKVVPRPVRTGVSNFFNNLGQPISAVNALLQGKPRQAGHSLGRFVVNSTLGIGGVFDPATDAKLENRNEDFGQTLGVWGWKRSRYVELPLLGPRTARDVVGLFGDAPLSVLRHVQSANVRVPLQGLQLVDMRMQLMSTDALRENVQDDYALVRDAWTQRRDYQISGGKSDDETPDYLREGPDMVPVDAIPVPGGH